MAANPVDSGAIGEPHGEEVARAWPGGVGRDRAPGAGGVRGRPASGTGGEPGPVTGDGAQGRSSTPPSRASARRSSQANTNPTRPSEANITMLAL